MRDNEDEESSRRRAENWREYRKNNPELCRSWENKYKKSDKGKQTRRAHFERNKEEKTKYIKDWNIKNKEKLLGYYKKYNTTHQPRLLAHAKKRGRLKKENGGTFSWDEWTSLCDKFGNKCLWCGRTDRKLTVDHVVPITKYGRNDIDNIQPLCRSCNSRKNNKILDFRVFGNAILEWT